MFVAIFIGRICFRGVTGRGLEIKMYYWDPIPTGRQGRDHAHWVNTGESGTPRCGGCGCGRRGGPARHHFCGGSARDGTLRYLHQQAELWHRELRAVWRQPDRVAVHADQPALHAGQDHHLRRHRPVDRGSRQARPPDRRRPRLQDAGRLREPRQPAADIAEYWRTLLRRDGRPVRQPDRERLVQTQRPDLHAASQQRAEHPARRFRRLG